MSHSARVPRGKRENLEYRRRLLYRALTDRDLQQGLALACREDVLFFVNSFVWQFNPRKKRGGLEVGPFLTWPFQEEALRVMLSCVEEDEDLVIEKSREMGASWLILILFLWLFLFRHNQTFLLISRGEKLVESESQDSLFWKLDFMTEHLPLWLRPGLVRRKLHLGNLSNGSSIGGEATTEKAGVGGRATAIVVDEFSQIKDDREILSRTSDTSGCRIFNFTHKGMGTAAYELTRRPEMRKLQMHWSLHPDKYPGAYRFNRDTQAVEVLDKDYAFPPDYRFVTDGTPTGGPFPGLRSPWYDRQCVRKAGARDVAMDLDIDPEGTVEQFFDPVTVRTLRETYCLPPLWEGDLDYGAEDGTPRALLAAPGGRIKLWFKPDRHGKPPRGQFVVGGDVATGSGSTPSCLSIANRTTGEKVGEYANPHIEPGELAVFGVALCRLFCDDAGEPGVFIWEIPGPGLTLGKKVMAMGFRNVYWKRSEFTLSKKRSDQPGWSASNENTDALLRDYRSALYGRQFLNRSAAAVNECTKFSYDKSGNLTHAQSHSPDDPSGARMNHGDQVIADALACKMCVRRVQLYGGDDEGVEEVQVGSLAWRRLLAESRSGTPW